MSARIFHWLDLRQRIELFQKFWKSITDFVKYLENKNNNLPEIKAATFKANNTIPISSIS